ncbi:hypothetical protein [Streptomyces iranensis]|uniref:Uncharacterized protein n=1 Tax=Streptomyces iranensis TaxID=576784 RepID=A0A060ZW58_9ACTN|nr:hypothetical protein [Streptomyces iranensis]MBP2059624.1 hypothetical protein [Streptomyces iranensis]CDR10372.1 predicted protein [Streptomyces iranensis]
MTTARSTASYARLCVVYAEQLAAQGVTASMLTHKWQAGDLIAPHSDLDIRVILDQTPGSWWEWNERLGTAHHQAVLLDPAHSRLLEHPPGFAFTVGELDRGHVSAAETSTWSLATGNAATLRRWQSRAQMMPWSRADERFYRGILDARIEGRYQLDKDSTDNVHHDLDAYRRHCIAWHYVAPCWFASAALATRTRCPGKTAALNQWHPGELEAVFEEVLRLSTTASDPGPSLTRLLRSAQATVDAVLRRTPPPAALPEESMAAAWTTTAGMLRVRVARWIYYLDPPPETATGYLIAREEKELRSARNTLTRLTDRTSGDDALLVKAMTGLLPPGPTTATTLRDLLALWSRHRSVVEDFLSTHST